MSNLATIRLAGASLALGLAALISPLMASSANAAVLSADLGKNLEYLQADNAGTTFPVGGAANAFFFARTFYSSGDFDGGSVSFGATTLPFNSQSMDCCGSTGGQYQTDLITKSQMDAMFPTGTLYTLEVTDSTHTNPTTDVHINLPADLYDATPIPTFDSASFDALNSLTPGQGLTIGTGTFTPDANATGGQSFLSIFDLTGNTAVFSDFGLNTRSSWTIGSGIFQAGHQYEAQLIFDNFVSSSDGSVPTTARSDLRTDVIFQLKAAVPEPATWAMMLVGFGGLGAVLRSRRNAIAIIA
jgi:hypothetical protein